MKYSKCDFCQYESRGKCIYPEYFRNQHNLCVKESDLNPCEEADDYMKTFGKNTKMTMTKQYLECLLEDVTNGLDYIDSLGNGKGEA